MKITKILVLVSILFIGCSDDKKKESDIDNLNNTPEVLNDTKSEVSFLRTKRYDENIIEELYSEALSKNEKLDKLNELIEEITSDSLYDKTSDYLKYTNINNRYWNTAKSYANKLNDSIKKVEVLAIIDKLETSYTKRIANHETKMDSIADLKTNLSDQLILMKLFVTEPMIYNYQSNELPDIEELKSIIKDYEKAIENSKEYTKIRK
jgi:hypothetical protein